MHITNSDISNKNSFIIYFKVQNIFFNELSVLMNSYKIRQPIKKKSIVKIQVPNNNVSTLLHQKVKVY